MIGKNCTRYRLVSVTTTSLYGKAKAGGMSQYDNLKHWKKMGYSQGSVAYKPKKETTKRLRDWLKKYHSEKYFEWYVALKLSDNHTNEITESFTSIRIL